MIADRSIGALAQGDVDAALAYARCAARHAGVVNVYQAARAETLRWNKGGEDAGNR